MPREEGDSRYAPISLDHRQADVAWRVVKRKFRGARWFSVNEVVDTHPFRTSTTLERSGYVRKLLQEEEVVQGPDGRLWLASAVEDHPKDLGDRASSPEVSPEGDSSTASDSIDEQPPVVLTADHIGGGWFNAVDSDGVAHNARPIRTREAVDEYIEEHGQQGDE